MMNTPSIFGKLIAQCNAAHTLHTYVGCVFARGLCLIFGNLQGDQKVTDSGFKSTE